MSDLKRRREVLGLTREEVAERTRIPLRFIVALEDGDDSEVRKGPFLASYRKQYDTFLRVDDLDQAPTDGPAPYVRVTDEDLPTGGPVSDGPPITRLVVGGFLATLALGLLVKVAGTVAGRPPAEDAPAAAGVEAEGITMVEAQSPVVTPAPPTPDAATPAPPTPDAAPPDAAPPDAAPAAPVGTAAERGLQTLALRATDPTRVAVRADGETLFSGILEPGPGKSFEGRDRLEVDASDLTRITVRHNGLRVEPLGNLTQGRRLVFIQESE